jgi:hypothetical protein
VQQGDSHVVAVGVETFGVVVVAAWMGAMGPGMRCTCLLALLVIAMITFVIGSVGVKVVWSVGVGSVTSELSRLDWFSRSWICCSHRYLICRCCRHGFRRLFC